MSLLDKFLDCVSYDTESDPAAGYSPSTETQRVFAAHLVDVMKEIGIKDAHVNECCHVMGSITANTERSNTVGFIAHMDTSPDQSGKNVKPRIIENYDGKDIVLNEKLGIVTTIKDFPNLTKYKGKKIVVTDGTTLLGSDDKSGITIILQAAEEIIKNNLPHGNIKIAFTPDEEVGGGINNFDVEGFGADFAYTLDGSTLGEIEYENFNAAEARIDIIGRSVHPGSAKDKMINASRVAMEFAGMLPPQEVPEHTEGYEGFYHLCSMEGSIENAVLEYIIRDHDRELLEKKKETLQRTADYINYKYGTELVKVTIKDNYSNMKEMILPHMDIIDLATDAMKQNGVTPITQPIRGGTDGARLSFMGLPCPNLCTGGENFHGKHEFACVDDMEKIKDIVLTIIANVK